MDLWIPFLIRSYILLIQILQCVNVLILSYSKPVVLPYVLATTALTGGYEQNSALVEHIYVPAPLFYRHANADRS